MGEYYASLFSQLYDLPIISLRYFNVYGPRQSLEDEYAVVVPKFITSLLKGEGPPIYGDGNQERDFTYIDNVVEANILSLIKKDVKGEVFNIAQGNPKSVNKLLEVLKEIIGKDIAAQYLSPRTGDPKKTHADIEISF
jgi:UDP-glucose 4-epimerase